MGIVLSGGGVKSTAHLGLLKALQEANIEPDIISGTSGGAIIGAMYSAGHDWETILEFCNNSPSWTRFNLFNQHAGLVDSTVCVHHLKKYLPTDSFAVLKKQLFVTATNLNQGESVVFSKGEIIRPVIASAAMPVLFTPVEINNLFYADGGIMNNFPVEPLLPICDQIIGSYLSKKVEHINQLSSKKDIVKRTLHLSREAIERHKFSACDYIFQPQGIQKISLLKREQFDLAFKVGYEEAKKQITRIKAALELPHTPLQSTALKNKHRLSLV